MKQSWGEEFKVKYEEEFLNYFNDYYNNPSVDQLLTHPSLTFTKPYRVISKAMAQFTGIFTESSEYNKAERYLNEGIIICNILILFLYTNRFYIRAD